MLSRVAAVKAPRTHNRRRVTGSSGRRREGRESEPQRPNMSRHLFYSAVLLLVLVMMCCGSGVAAQSDVPAPDPGSSLGKHFVWMDKKKEETVSLLYAPSLLDVNGKVFAVAEAQCTENDKVSTGIASKLLTLDKKQTKEELDASKVKTQVLEECPSVKAKCASQPEEKDVSQSEAKVDVSRPTTVVKGSDIYMLVGKYSRRDATDQEDRGAEDCGLLLVKGKAGGESSDSIIWGDTAGVPCVSTVEEEKVGSTRLIGSGGSGVKMHDDTLVFPVEATKKEESGKTVSLTIYSSDNAASWKLSKGMSDGGCSDPSVVEWEKDEKKLIMMTACDDGRRRVYESSDKGESWTEALGTLSRVWGNKKGETVEIVGSGFTTAKIDNKNVMLITLPVYPEKDGEGNQKSELHLWLTDNTHIVDIGPVSGEDDVAASSLLYKSAESKDKKDELIALYEKKNGNEDTSLGMFSVLLTAQLQRVKDVLATWKKVDDLVSKLCPSSAAKDGSPGDACSPTVKITDGLVGFLSGNFSENTWRDEYLGVNATLKGNDEGKKATLHEGGVTFTGAWAEWPVGAQGENQLYHFANYNFTLVATVSIDKVPEGITHIPLMGVKMNDDKNSILFGLSYDKEGKWKLSCGGGQNKDHSSNWEPGRTHQLAIVLRNGTQASAYVDGQRVGGNAQCQLDNTEPKGISHFYIGGDGSSADGAGIEEGVSVTVTNVLLYNRPLDDAEINAINKNKHFIQRLTDLKNVPRDTRPPGVDTQPTLAAVSESTRHGQPPLKNEPLKGEGAGSGGVSNSAETTVTTSSVGSQSAEQLPSGGSHDGNKNVNVDSSSDAVPTVGTVGGDTTQANGSPQIPVGISDTADANTPAAEGEGQDGPTVNPEVGASSGENGELTEGTNGQVEEIHPQDGEVNTTVLSSLGNVSQGNNSDAGTVRESRMLPSLLLLLGLWVFAAL
ncbi:trans-sialidase [Trypanosoma cruzi Dm28c]|uniref:Trans-sialidase n=2 Tax=Trypanosoma cruzi TaxID=5693 RepID=V5D1F7_TRYCR|nr:trans-sialidase [Trypanosoma cruzi Dm28c]PBJ77093.1 trans-sialidase [Trypanosoma cruzi cruzi]PWU86320.1 putative trans-sialidase, Group VI [Trypanosoma cruzi]